MNNNTTKAIGLGVLASLFFATTFILNKSMNLSGGSYLWSASLRFFFMMPMFYMLLKMKKETAPVYKTIKENPWKWLVWSTVGFGIFYLPITFASQYGSSWLVAGTWQMTIVAGAVLTPLWGQKIPRKTLLFSSVILAGVFLLQLEHAQKTALTDIIGSVLPVLIAAFAYPLGNRQMMILCKNQLTTTQRIYGMTLSSMPFWILVSVGGFLDSGLPSSSQLFQSLLVAIFSGTIATILFFKATDLVKNDMKHLAIVEATQAGEVIFTVLGGMILLGDMGPQFFGIIGLILIIVGMVANSYGIRRK